MLYNVKRGFTLMEILIVVLIIGVLTAIAVPQYQQAVLKSRFSSLMPTTKAIRDGNDVYYMEHGHYSGTLADLDVTTQTDTGQTWNLSDDIDHAYVKATRSDMANKANLIMYQKHSVNFPGEIHCEALEGDTQAEWLCGTALHGTPLTSGSVSAGYNTYILEGNGTGLFSGDDNTLTCDAATAMGLTCSITTNAQGQTVKQVCINGVCRTKTYDEDGGYTSVTCKANSENECTSNESLARYDANGNRTSVATCSGHDGRSGMCVQLYDSDFEYTYDENGNMTSSRRCSSRDSSGKCTGWSVVSSYEYTYDANGNTTSVRQCSSVDSSGKCTAYSSNYNNSYDYTYDASGNLTSQRECSSVDSSGKCTQYSEGGSFDYTYDANGNMTSKLNCDLPESSGKCSSLYGYGYEYTYDKNGNQTSQRYCRSMNSSNGKCTYYGAEEAFVYTYDTNGNRTSQRNCDSVDSNGNCTEYSDYYAYDYTYDANGNQTSQRRCNSVDSNGKCTAYDYSEYYMYDDDGKQMTSQSCSNSNLNTSTGECIAGGVSIDAY